MQAPLKYDQTPKTPIVDFDAATGILLLKGKSIPENSIQFYKPIFDWLDNYIQQPAANTILNVQFDYFNTASSKCIVDVFKKLDVLIKSGKGNAQINWHYLEEDDDMLEVGEDYQSIIKVPFNLVAIEA